MNEYEQAEAKAMESEPRISEVEILHKTITVLSNELDRLEAVLQPVLEPLGAEKAHLEDVMEPGSEIRTTRIRLEAVVAKVVGLTYRVQA